MRSLLGGTFVKTLKIGGEAGFGVMSAGLNFSKIALRSGYHVFNYTEYPSLIRGGHNVMQVAFSVEPVGTQFQTTDVLVALNQETLDLHVGELTKDAIVIFDSETVTEVDSIKKFSAIGVPLSAIVREVEGAYIMRNNVALGAVCGALGVDPKVLLSVVDEELKAAPSEIVEKNNKACYAGYEYVLKNNKAQVTTWLKPTGNKLDKLVMTGNESVALGAVAAGMNFFAIYPMTPTSNIMHTLTPLQEKFGFIYKQPEDEISAINMAIGASFAGARSMVATSGGGFCLMTEGFGLAGMTETPVVIIEGMRSGPATGLPTWTEQGDLRFVLSAHQSDFLRIVVAPGDADEAFDLTFKAFNLAEKYQTPVVVLVDRYLCESHFNVNTFDLSKLAVDRGKLIDYDGGEYKRFVDSADGISPRVLPGKGAYFITNSDEHDEFGYSTEEISDRLMQHKKRNQKGVTLAANEMEPPVLFGPESADVTVLSWGSNKGAILEALKSFSNVNFIHTTWMNPFPVEEFKKIVGSAKKRLEGHALVIFECNYSGQFAGLVKEKTGITADEMVLKYDGRPFYPEEIVAKLREMGAK